VRHYTSADVALRHNVDHDRLLAELEVLNKARNAVAHEWAFVPRMRAVMPFVRVILDDQTMQDVLPAHDVSLRFMERLRSWEEEHLRAIRVNM
jgi:hypothetical protein